MWFDSEQRKIKWKDQPQHGRGEEQGEEEEEEEQDVHHSQVDREHSQRKGNFWKS